jgi:Domain of unknown function (DUF1707)
MTSHDRHARWTRPSIVLSWLATTGWETHQFARRRRMRSMRLTEAERDACTGELAEQYALGRIDKPELDRRVDLLHRSVTRGELKAVFAGLPTPSLDRPAARSGRWRWVVFAAAAWLAMPFLLIGLVFGAAGREGAAAFFVLPASLWMLLWWRWASVDRASGSLSRHH